MVDYHKYKLEEKNRRRLNEIYAKAMVIAIALYTDDEKKSVDKNTLETIIRKAVEIRTIAFDIAEELKIDFFENGN